MDLLIHYHAVDHLPGGAAATIYDGPGHRPSCPDCGREPFIARRCGCPEDSDAVWEVHIYLTRDRDLGEVCAVLGPVVTEWSARSYDKSPLAWPAAG